MKRPEHRPHQPHPEAPLHEDAGAPAYVEEDEAHIELEVASEYHSTMQEHAGSGDAHLDSSVGPSTSKRQRELSFDLAEDPGLEEVQLIAHKKALESGNFQQMELCVPPKDAAQEPGACFTLARPTSQSNCADAEMYELEIAQDIADGSKAKTRDEPVQQPLIPLMYPGRKGKTPVVPKVVPSVRA